MSNGTTVTVGAGKYKGMSGVVVGVHGRDVSVRVDGVPFVQVYGKDEVSVG